MSRSNGHTPREAAAFACILIGSICLGAAAALFVGEHNLFVAEVFGKRAEESLSNPGVAAYAADFVTNTAIGAQPDLIAVRPLIEATAHAVVTARPFRALVGLAARRAHEAAFSEGGRRVLLSMPDFSVLLHEALAQANPALSAKLPKNVTGVIASLDGHRARLVIDIWRMGGHLRWLWEILFPASLVFLILAVSLAENRRRALVRVGISLIVTGIVLASFVPAGRLAAGMIDKPLERELVRGLWRTFLGGFLDWGLFIAGLGVFLAAGAASLLEHLDPLARVRRLSRLLIAPPPSTAGRTAWGAVLLIGGLIAAFHPQELLDGAVVVIAVCAAFIGSRELFRLFLEKFAHIQADDSDHTGLRWTIAAAAVFIIVGAISTAWFVWRNPVVKAATPSTMACNGYAELCGRPVDKVSFAGAHNAMSNQSVPGWMFPHHQAGIPQMLRDGIRALLIDVHYGFPGGSRIKTDFASEPITDKVKEAIGAEGYQAALRIRNELVGVDEGKRGVYLCHGVCELGAYELEPTLEEIRAFLLSHPDEVLIIIFEDYVTTQELAKRIEQSRLSDLVYRGPGGPDWPTLGKLIDSGQRLIVFIESGKPGVAWLRPAFETFKETPYSFHKIEEFSCRPNRGGEGGSLFLMNHWIETTPTPRPSNAAIVNAYDFLLARANKCADERRHIPNIVAVDFYRSGDLVRVVDRLNGVEKTP